MWHEWFKREMVSEFRWESYKKRRYFEDVLLDGKIKKNINLKEPVCDGVDSSGSG